MKNILIWETLSHEDRIRVKQVSGRVAKCTSAIIHAVAEAVRNTPSTPDEDSPFVNEDIQFLLSFNIKISLFFMDFEGFFIDMYLPATEGAYVEGSETVQ